MIHKFIKTSFIYSYIYFKFMKIRVHHKIDDQCMRSYVNNWKTCN